MVAFSTYYYTLSELDDQDDRMAGVSSALLALAAVLMLSCAGALATTHVVGDSLGWTVPTPENGNFNYTTWAEGQEFFVGDELSEFSMPVLVFLISFRSSPLRDSSTPHSRVTKPYYRVDIRY